MHEKRGVRGTSICMQERGFRYYPMGLQKRELLFGVLLLLLAATPCRVSSRRLTMVKSQASAVFHAAAAGSLEIDTAMRYDSNVSKVPKEEKFTLTRRLDYPTPKMRPGGNSRETLDQLDYPQPRTHPPTNPQDQGSKQPRT